MDILEQQVIAVLNERIAFLKSENARIRLIPPRSESCGKCSKPLTLFTTPTDTYGCDDCGIRLQKGAEMYGCRACDYDLCASCVVISKYTAMVSSSSYVAPEVEFFLNAESEIYNNAANGKVDVELFLTTAAWLACAVSVAHTHPAVKQAARQLLGVEAFTMNLGAAGAFAYLKSTLKRFLQQRGLPLRESYIKENRKEVIGVIANTPLHPLAVGHKLRLDMPGLLPLPPWSFSGYQERSSSERSFIHMTIMVSTAVNQRFHEMAREALAPHAIPGLGAMKLDAKVSPVKGFARMNNKRVKDHHSEEGCRPALNVDCCRLIAVVESAEALVATVRAIAKQFGGVGRIKDGFAAADASEGFDLRTVMCNCVVDFDCDFSTLREQNGVKGSWDAHVASMPEGGQPRGQWASEASRALEWLMSQEIAPKPVRFVCEVQVLIRDVLEVRTSMHELYKAYRADDCSSLYSDFLAEKYKIATKEAFERDGSTPLKLACRDGDCAEASRLMTASGVDGTECCAQPGILRAQLLAMYQKAGPNGTAPDPDNISTVPGALEIPCEQLRYWLKKSFGDLAPAILHSPALCFEDREQAFVVACSYGHEAIVKLPGFSTQEPPIACPILQGPIKGKFSVGCAMRKWNLAWMSSYGRSFESDGSHVEVLRKAIPSGVLDVLLGVAEKIPELLDEPLNASGTNPLIGCAQCGHLLAVQRLLAAGANVDASTTNGTTALWSAASNGHDDVVTVLIQAGAAVDAVACGARGLDQAAQNGHAKVIECLLQAGADVQVPLPGYTTGSSALWHCCRAGHDDAVVLLLGAGATVTYTYDDDGGGGRQIDDPLFVAAMRGHSGVVKLLIGAGADVNKLSMAGASPLYWPTKTGNTAIVELLQAAGGRCIG